MRYARTLPVRWPSGEDVEVLMAIGHQHRRRLVAAELAGYGIPVRELGTGQEVIEAVRRVRERRGGRSRGRLPLVFADMLVSPDGLSVLTALRNLGLDGPFVLIVGEADRELRTMVRDRGGVAVNEHVIDLEDLSTVMIAAWYRVRGPQRTPNETTPPPDRRRYRRLPLEIWIEQCDPLSTTIYHTRSANLSQGGLSLRQGVPEVTGKMYYLSFDLPGTSPLVEVTSKIVNVRPTGRDFSVGMHFLDLPRCARRSIAQLEPAGR